MGADFTRLLASLDAGLDAHVKRDGMSPVAAAVFLARGGHAPGEVCPTAPPPDPHECWCASPDDACTCGADQLPAALDGGPGPEPTATPRPPVDTSWIRMVPTDGRTAPDTTPRYCRTGIRPLGWGLYEVRLHDLDPIGQIHMDCWPVVPGRRWARSKARRMAAAYDRARARVWPPPPGGGQHLNPAGAAAIPPATSPVPPPPPPPPGGAHPDTGDRCDPAGLAGLLRTAATGRREYLTNCPDPDLRTVIETEANTLDQVARVVDGDLRPLYSWLPSWRWTPDMIDALATRPPANPQDPPTSPGPGAS